MDLPTSQKAFTCEGCESEPPEVSNVELTPNPQGVTRTTLCLPCLAVLQELPPGEPRVVALINRIADFKEAWPVKADMNIVAYASSIAKSEPDKALRIVKAWSRGKRTKAA